MTPEQPRGRPRGEGARQAILAAALGIAAEDGYAALTVEGIAARAGVGKQTIYRWWPTKADVLLEAGAAKADLRVPVTDRGSYAADLRAYLAWCATRFLDVFAATRPHIEIYVRWLEEDRHLALPPSPGGCPR